MNTRIYLQSEHLPDTTLVEVDSRATFREAQDACLKALPAHVRELELFFFREDADEEVAVVLVAELETPNGIRLHAHGCKHVHVTVRFNGQSKPHEFRPSATIARVKKWAAHAFGLSEADALEHVLQVTGTTEQPDVDVHVGTLAKCPACSVSFDLVPAHRINGSGRQ